jgi:hypothetical protein
MSKGKTKQNKKLRRQFAWPLVLSQLIHREPVAQFLTQAWQLLVDGNCW